MLYNTTPRYGSFLCSYLLASQPKGWQSLGQLTTSPRLPAPPVKAETNRACTLHLKAPKRLYLRIVFYLVVI
ncbi:Hypothetical predicted protein [Cloeon dipterum]|uniref:Uncharacterized protein n=1 Tax=Cloeon dipterum TaxID=197152 RepID=A0A8S1D585_9INSE|nr:Hypothetical predicted protein [Cloeon dipterum]